MRQFEKPCCSAIPALGLLIACSVTTGPDGSRRALGILQLESFAPAPATAGGGPTGTITWNLPPGEHITYPPNVIDAPDTVTLGQTAPVTVYTIGPNGCWAADGLDVARSGRVVEITAWDRHSGAEVCTMVLGYLAHTTTVTFDQAGEWTIRLRGRRVRGGASPDLSVTAERVVFVRAG